MMQAGDIPLGERYIKEMAVMDVLILLNIWQKRFMKTLKKVLLLFAMKKKIKIFYGKIFKFTVKEIFSIDESLKYVKISI